MKLRVRPWFVTPTATVTLALLGACGPVITEVATNGNSEGSSGESTGGPTPPGPTTAMTTTPDPSAGSGDATGDPDTGPSPDGTTGDPGSDGCCEAHASPGCDEARVVDCVCAQEASCCAFEWAQGCVDLAMGECMATCEGSTSGDTEGSTGEPGGACDEIVQLELFPADATHTGAWGLVSSAYEPYEVSGIDQGRGTDGSVLYEPDIPCDDTWYIWVRYWEQGSNDSYFATIDGEPTPAAIFEGDCTNAPFNTRYAWRLLNWRDQGAMSCSYAADPWAPEWTAGVHAIEFSYRESIALGRIVITNDETFVPPGA